MPPDVVGRDQVHDAEDSELDDEVFAGDDLLVFRIPAAAAPSTENA